jgi:hypothetical protein
MRTDEQCLINAAEMQYAAYNCPDAAIAAAYEELAVSWREAARLAAWQDWFLQ